MNSSSESKQQTKARRRKRPPKEGVARFVEGLTPRIEPIVPPKVALEGAHRVFLIAAEHPARKSGALSDGALKQHVTAIVNGYWFERAWYERLGPQHPSKEVQKVEKAAASFLRVLGDAPAYARAAISHRMYFHAASPDSQNELKSTEEAVRKVLDGCRRIPKVAGRRGTREKRHVEITAKALVQLWFEMSGEPFVFNLEPHPLVGRHKAFVYEGPLFVYQMIEAIDPEVSDPGGIFEEVSNALKKVSESRKAPSENSA